MDIHILPANIANMIAAGEVVQRPASVVKELMENAVDAGAGKVSVIVEDAGRTMIQVLDNGCGMTPDQAVLCFQRHATSKIATAEDLHAIQTFGFRGEALASIAAVAEVVLRTRTAADDVATQVTISDATANDPGRQDIAQVAGPVGSSFTVRNLYYNTPARRKFLKSDATEMKAIISEFIKVALCRTDMAFTLHAGGRDIYKLSPAKSLMYRIQDIFGSPVASELLPVDADTSIVRLTGFVTRPESAKKAALNQYFFVNGRYFRSAYLNKAVQKAYENLIPDGSSASYFLFLELDPAAIDINVHPTKTEIKFEDDNILFNVMIAAVREAVGRSSFCDNLDFEGGGLPSLHNVGSSFDEFRPVTEPQIGSNASFNPFDNDGFPNEGEVSGSQAGGGYSHGGNGAGDWASGSGNSAGNGAGGWYRQKPGLEGQDLSRLFDSVPGGNHPGILDGAGGASVPTSCAAGGMLISGRHIIKKTSSGFILADAAKAMQRILYEEFMEALAKEECVAQTALFPIEVYVGAENVPVLDHCSQLLSRLGFELSVFDTGSVTVNALPEGMVDDNMAVSALIYEIVTALGDEQASIASAVYAPLAEKLAKSGSRAAKLPSNEAELSALLDRLYNCENPEFTSDGRRIVTVLSSEALDKLLK